MAWTTTGWLAITLRLPWVQIALKDEYLHTGHEPKVAGAGLKVNAPNDGYKKL
ncbi:MAG: hypothetical protein QXN78_05360 [Conexivisphaerales archaeon]